MNHKKYFNGIIKSAYSWNPYAQIIIPKDIDFRRLNRVAKEYTCVKNREHMLRTGTFTIDVIEAGNAEKFAKSNVLVLNKFINNKDNGRIYTVFGSDPNWLVKACLAKERFENISVACNIIKNVYIIN